MTYNYLCKLCKKKLEVIQKITEEPLVICPECGEDALVRLISISVFHLKGSGYYATDKEK